MKRIIGTLLIVLAIWIGVDGVRKFDDSTEDVKFLGIRFHAEDSSKKDTAFLEIALGVVVLVGGVSLLGKTKEALG